MKAVIDNATNRAIYLFNNDDSVSIDDSGMHTASFDALDIKPTTHTIVSAPDLPGAWLGGAWTLINGVWAIADQARYDDYVTNNLAGAKGARKAAAAAKRYAIETAGIVVDGQTIRTDRESQGLITGADTKSLLDSAYVFKFKTASGVWISLDKDAIQMVGGAALDHVQKSFLRESEIDDEIDAINITDTVNAVQAIAAVNAVDIDSGWPETAPISAS